MRFKHFGWLLALLPVVGAAQTVRCVASLSQFTSALNEFDGDDLEIRLVRGTYDFSEYSASGDPDRLILKGGYTAGCGSRSLDARLTVITAPTREFALRLRVPGEFRLSSLAFRNIPNGVVFDMDDPFEETLLRMDRVWFDQAGNVSVDDSDEIFVNQVAVTRSNRTCAFEAGTDSSAGFNTDSSLELLSLSHVTIAQNAARGLCVGRTDQTGTWRIEAVNSIFYGNGTADLYLRRDNASTIPARLRNSTYQTLNTNLTLDPAPTGTQTSNPQFVDPGNGNIALGGSSPAINSALLLGDSATAVDLHGDPRLFGTAPDRGALESEVGTTATTIVVTSNNDSGTGTLRQALLDANAASNFNRIHFNIPGACPRVITLSTLLPEITQPAWINGYTQPGSARNTLAVGNNADLCVILQQLPNSLANSGLTVGASAADSVSTTIEGLGFTNFLLAAVNLFGGSEHVVRGIQIGGTINTLNALPSGWGVVVGSGVPGVRIGGSEESDRNVLAESNFAGIRLRGTGTQVENNYIGTEPNGATPAANAIGIDISGTAGSGANVIVNNVISANTDNGVLIDDKANNILRGNRIGIPALCFESIGSCDLGNGENGILIQGDSALNNTIENNIITFNNRDGVSVIDGAHSNRIRDNTMYGNTGLGIDLGTNGVNPIDNDCDAPPANAGNRNLNAPSLSVAVGKDSFGYVSGSLSSCTGDFQIAFFASNDSCPLPIFNDTNQGRFPLGTLDLNGFVGQQTKTFRNFRIARAGSPTFFSTPKSIIAVATRKGSSPDSSEFSRCITFRNELIFLDGFED